MNEVFQNISALVVTACLLIYWAAVIVKLFRLARKIGKDPNALPREPLGQLMRVLWYPIVIVMLVAASIVALHRYGHIAKHVPVLGTWLTPLNEPTLGWSIASLAAMIICVAATVITFICWHRMGRSWRIGIDPGEKLDLVCTGPYRYIRHPIYALRMAIDVTAIVALPAYLVAIPALIDILLMQIEARREENYMIATHGQTYLNYKKSVGRFLPRLTLV